VLHYHLCPTLSAARICLHTNEIILGWGEWTQFKCKSISDEVDSRQVWCFFILVRVRVGERGMQMSECVYFRPTMQALIRFRHLIAPVHANEKAKMAPQKSGITRV